MAKRLRLGMTPMEEEGEEDMDMTVRLEPNLSSLLASCGSPVAPMVGDLPSRSSLEQALSDRELMQERAKRAEEACRELRAETEELRASRNWLAHELEERHNERPSFLPVSSKSTEDASTRIAEQLAAEKDENERLRIEMHRLRREMHAERSSMAETRQKEEESVVDTTELQSALSDASEAREEAARANRQILELRAELARERAGTNTKSHFIKSETKVKAAASLSMRTAEERIRTLESLLEQYAKSHEENADLRKELESSRLREDEWNRHFGKPTLPNDKKLTAPAACALAQITQLEKETRQLRLELSEALASSRNNAAQSAEAIEAEAEARSKCEALDAENKQLSRDLSLALAARAVDARELNSLRRLLNSTLSATSDDAADLRKLIAEASKATDEARSAYDTLLKHIQEAPKTQPPVHQNQVITQSAQTGSEEEVRIVHMIKNPFSDAQKAREASMLLRRRNNNEDMDTTVDSAKLHARLKERFREHLNWFREAVYLLTGFKLEMTNNTNDSDDDAAAGTTVRLRSMFAENADDALLFRWTDDGIQLIDTPFARNLDDRLFAPLRYLNSTPAFLATIQLDLFEKSTLLPSSVDFS